MAKYIWKLRVQLLLCTIIMVAANADEKTPHTGVGIIANFLQNFIKPYLRSTSEQAEIDDIKKEAAIEKLVIKKIAELKHLLEDNTEKIDTEDKLTLRGNNETTVIEFLPKTVRKNNDKHEIMKTILKPDPLKSTINKYKTLRHKIKVMLERENVSEDTKTLIIKTLDDMIAHLIESQCLWTLNKQQARAQNDTKDSLLKVRNMTKKQWKNLRRQYVEYLTNRVEKENAFIKQFHNFFSNVLNDTNNLGERYKIRCQLVEVDKDEDKEIDKEIHHDTDTTTKVLLRDALSTTTTTQNTSNSSRQEKNSTKKQICEIFTLCSSELREFFIQFYNSLNDTTVNTFKNYASMYSKDVNTDLGVEKDVVISIINKIGVTAEENVNEVYKKELKKFTLDPDKLKIRNMEYIKQFIKKTVSKVQKVVKKKLINKIDGIKGELFLTVKEDLSVNIEVDLDNLQKQYSDTFCELFVTCNGRYVARRLNNPWTFRPRNNNEIYVKVQLSLDDDMKKAAIKSGLVKMLLQPQHKKYIINKNDRKTDLRTGKHIIIVTRTTLKNARRIITIKSNPNIPAANNKTLLYDKKVSKENEIIKS